MSSESSLRQFITADELRRTLQCSLALVRKKTQSGGWPHLKIGRSVRYDLDAVLAYLRHQQQEK